ncbi:hypothetical protein M9Y10_038014 [Tritrichomonas musculus]|uniref:USP domain-containing protein n=1 Tax=Tritrichomonas musculus TaxID=1915356 RepID=A0ABR2K7A1_9EUKA
MTQGLKELLPAEQITPEIVEGALSSWKKTSPANEFVYHEYEKKSNIKSSNIMCFLYTLVSTPHFVEFSKTEPFATAEDLQFGPELCGQDIFDKYLHDTNFASRFFWLVNQIKSQNQNENIKSREFVKNIIEDNPSNSQILSFLTTMIQYIDNANCWPYLPLPEKVPSFLFQNPLRQLFCSRKLNSVEPFVHIYIPNGTKSLQTLLLESGPLLDAPKAICFTCPDSNNNETSNSNYQLTQDKLVPTLGLPLAVTRDVFEKTCERCYAWEKSNVAQDAKEKVLTAYHDAIILETYQLSSYVAVDKDKSYYVLRDNQTKSDNSKSKRPDAVVLSAIYSIIE